VSVAVDIAPLGETADLLKARSWVALTGAGISTDSGIPDYRGPTSARATPMQYGEFVSSADAQRRYWARSFLGWQRIGQAKPNDGHRLLVDLESAGLCGVITQNVDGLHTAAGSSRVINLHGEIATVVCLDCRHRTSRRAVQNRLSRLNPDLDTTRATDSFSVRPDGDAVMDSWRTFVLPDCMVCGGRLKPDVVFFGESVPKSRVEGAYRLVDDADVLVVLGSSLTVMSGLRFVRHSAKNGRPVVIINRGSTRGDHLAMIKIECGCSEALGALTALLAV
jgi:NAD-dependent SIR2 family protein deacetylase